LKRLSRGDEALRVVLDALSGLRAATLTESRFAVKFRLPRREILQTLRWLKLTMHGHLLAT